jgi:hypothetical protein
MSRQRIMWTFLLALLASIVGLQGTLAASKAERPDHSEMSLVWPGDPTGEMPIKLKPPSFSDVEQVKQHLVFSRLAGRLFSSELRARTAGSCSTLVDTAPFPDLSALFYTAVSSGNNERASCMNRLHDIVQSFEPDKQAIRAAASELAAEIRRGQLDPGGHARAVAIATLEAISRTYAADDLMHALVSVDLDARLFETVDPEVFGTWLSEQKRALTFDARSTEELSIRTALRSPLLRAGDSVTVPMRKSYADMGALQHFVVVGNDYGVMGKVYKPVDSPATTKLCNQKREFELTDAAGAKLAMPVTIRCVVSSIYNVETWVALYCDPTEVVSADVAEKVALALMSDADVVDLARRRVDGRGAAGPYLVLARDGYRP